MRMTLQDRLCEELCTLSTEYSIEPSIKTLQPVIEKLYECEDYLGEVPVLVEFREDVTELALLHRSRRQRRPKMTPRARRWLATKFGWDLAAMQRELGDDFDKKLSKTLRGLRRRGELDEWRYQRLLSEE